MISQETVRLILDTARIEDIVGDFVTLKRNGSSYKACCPFHNEKTPSFVVTPSRGIYKCFGCGKAGGPVNFLMEYDHLTYPEALRYIADKYHIAIEEEELSAEEIQARQKTESLHLVMDFAQKFYVSQLDTAEGRAVAMAYYTRRGLTPETVRKFGLGWAPSGRTALIDAALAQGFKMEYLEEAGLVKVYDDGTRADKFRERVTFPIYSVSGRVIAYSCRTLKADSDVKYINSSETPLYVKSRALLGIFHAKNEIAKQDRCYLVEGNYDVITLQQLGICNVVASCGTSLTSDQIRLIRRFSSNLTIMYDGDKAGIHAAIRGIDLALAEGMNVKVLLFPEGQDPDEFGRTHTLEEFRAFIAAGETDFIEFKADLLLEEAAGDPLRKASMIGGIADSIARIPDEIVRTVYIQTCADKFGIDKEIICRRVLATRKAAVSEPVRPQNTPQTASHPDIPSQPQPVREPALAASERELAGFLLRYGREPLKFSQDSEFYNPDAEQTVCEFIRSVVDSDVDGGLSDPGVKSLYDTYLRCYDEGMDDTAIQKRILDGEDRALASLAADVCIDKYELTLTSFRNALTARDTWLTQYVPKAILYWQLARVQSWTAAQMRRLERPEEGDDASLGVKRLMDLQKMQKTIRQRIETIRI